MSAETQNSAFAGFESEEPQEYRDTTIAAAVEPSLAETVERFARSQASPLETKSDIIREATMEFVGYE